MKRWIAKKILKKLNQRNDEYKEWEKKEKKKLGSNQEHNT